MLNAETYITHQKGIGGKIRTKYEDFYVEEIPESTPSGEGPNTWFFIEKIGRDTLDVVLDVAQELHIDRKRMGFAGMKDKRAVTRQWLCVANLEVEQIQELEDKLYKVKILKIMQNQKKLRIGQLIGNKFRLLIRDTENPEADVEIANEILAELSQKGVPNYFGWQRFGKARSNTHIVGKKLLENDLGKVVDAYIGNPYDEEPEHIKEVRQMYDDGKLEESLESMPKGMRYEKMMLKTLLKEMKKKKIESKEELDEKSYIRAIESLPKPLKRMFVHAYQSYLFNKAVSERSKLGIDKYVEGDIIADNDEHLVHEFGDEIDERIKNFEVHPTAPLFGSKVPLAGGKLGEMEQKILDDEGVTLEEFKVPKMPRLGSHGLRRAMRFKIWDVSAKATDEGVLVEFSIPKGCYATAVLREIMKNEVV
ncbi:MAG: tRNA pseudouridine(13) synthase TruD [Methanobacterium sp.]|uniref:tRNA pseudouridine(13) synthase TruD n=1 Tax=Methanobacterium sp. TaxID=2164 RepID=UPI003D6472C6|nr:tRNA pseudouridine(13) synthase TruD [Methanobacterium sp.]